MDQKYVFLTILGMTAVTYLPRLLPAWFLSSRTLPPVVGDWLRQVPVAVLSAMLLPSLLLKDAHFDFGLDNLYLWAAFPTFLVAWLTRNLFATVFAGMAVVSIVRLIL